MRNKVIFYLNGKRHAVGADKAGMMLAEYLRYDQGLTGTKIVCAEGDCGACSVLRYFPFAKGENAQNFLPINSCISLVAQLDGSSLITVDALKDYDDLHEAQSAMVKCHGSQCGFCTPGFVMALSGLVEDKLSRKEKTIEVQEAKNCMTGNLCRCTGYQPIIDAALKIDLKKCESLKKRFTTEAQKKDLEEAFKLGVGLERENFTFYAPKTIKEALTFLKSHPDARLLGSATDLGVVHNKRKTSLTKLVSLHLMEEFYRMECKNNKVKIGARVTLGEFREFLKGKCPEFAHYLDVFASPQIKNIATVVGNVANASPIGDTPPALLVLEASVIVAGASGTYETPLDEFFLAYRKTSLKAGEVIIGLTFNLPDKRTDFRLFKNANRKDLDISVVNFAIKVDWKDEAKKEIKNILIAAGGVAAIPLRFKKTEDYLKHHTLDLDQAAAILHSEIKPLSDVRATSAYRHVLAENFLRRFFQEVGGAP